MIHANSDSVRAVAAAVDSFNEGLEALKTTLTTAVAQAREGWPDERGDAAEGSVQEMVNGIDVSEEASRISQECTTLADKLDEL